MKTVLQTLLTESSNWNCRTFKMSFYLRCFQRQQFPQCSANTSKKTKKCPARFYWGRLWRPACFAGLRKISLGFATSDSRWSLRDYVCRFRWQMKEKRPQTVLQFRQSSLKTQKLRDGVRQSNVNRPCRALNSIPWSRILGQSAGSVSMSSVVERCGEVLCASACMLSAFASDGALNRFLVCLV